MSTISKEDFFKILNNSNLLANNGSTINIFIGDINRVNKALNKSEIPSLDNELLKYDSKLKRQIYNLKINDAFQILGIVKRKSHSGLFNNKTLIVWPVKVKNAITIIHLAQIQTLKYLQKRFKVKINVLIVGRYEETRIDINTRKTFKKELEYYLTYNELVFDIKTLTDIYKKNTIQKKYLDLSHYIKLETLKKFKVKNYPNKEDKERDFLSQKMIHSTNILYTYAYISINQSKQESYGIKRSIILAGEDEYEAWDGMLTDDKLSKIGAIFIPRLSGEDQIHDYDQSINKNSPSEYLLKKLLQTDLSAQWLIKMFFIQPLLSSISIKDIIEVCKVLNPKIDTLSFSLDNDDYIQKILEYLIKVRFCSSIILDD